MATCEFSEVLQKIERGDYPALTGMALTQDQANQLKNAMPDNNDLYVSSVINTRIIQ